MSHVHHRSVGIGLIMRGKREEERARGPIWGNEGMR